MVPQPRLLPQVRISRLVQSKFEVAKCLHKRDNVNADVPARLCPLAPLPVCGGVGVRERGMAREAELILNLEHDAVEAPLL